MNLTIDDRARLLPLLRFANAVMRASLKAGGLNQPEDLADSLEWGEDFLRRLEALDEA